MAETKNIYKATKFIQETTEHFRPEIGMILGSGLGPVADAIKDPMYINYQDIPGFPVSTVEGHAGRLVLGNLNGKNVMVMQGRFHFYEGYPMPLIGFPVQVMKKLGVSKMIVTAASGAVTTDLQPGDLMVITDHINLTFRHPLMGQKLSISDELSSQTSKVYDPDLSNIALETGRKLGIEIKSGVYVMATGPSFETRAEVRMARLVGGDVVGMSTVPEATAAALMGIKVLGMTYVSNSGTGISQKQLSHHDVLDTMSRIQQRVVSLISETVGNL